MSFGKVSLVVLYLLFYLEFRTGVGDLPNSITFRFSLAKPQLYFIFILENTSVGLLCCVLFFTTGENLWHLSFFPVKGTSAIFQPGEGKHSVALVSSATFLIWFSCCNFFSGLTSLRIMGNSRLSFIFRFTIFYIVRILFCCMFSHLNEPGHWVLPIPLPQLHRGSL